MFNVWLPAALENRAAGEGDQAIRVALKEFVLYSCSSITASHTTVSLNYSLFSRRVSGFDRRRVDDPNPSGPSQIPCYMHNGNGALDLCVYQSEAGLGGNRELDDYLGGGDGDVRCAL
jgi:hypothetical protein